MELLKVLLGCAAVAAAGVVLALATAASMTSCAQRYKTGLGLDVVVRGSFEIDTDAIDDEIRWLALCLYSRGLLTREQTIAHARRVLIEIYQPLDDGSGAVPWLGSTRKEGACYDKFNIAYTWRQPPEKTALRYEMINALLWNFYGHEFAAQELSSMRAEWDACQ